MITLTHEHYIFDTTVFIDYLKGRPVAQQILRQAQQNGVHVGYSILTEAELWAGIVGKRTEQEHLRLLRLFTRYNLNVAIARQAGELKARCIAQKGGRVPSLNDCLIAATADYYGMVVVTRNTSDFSLLHPIPYQTYTL
jgi:predicted nucleic acid-binding protein